MSVQTSVGQAGEVQRRNAPPSLSGCKTAEELQSIFFLGVHRFPWLQWMHVTYKLYTGFIVKGYSGYSHSFALFLRLSKT